MKTEMNKSDLKTGMIIETRDKKFLVVYTNTFARGDYVSGKSIGYDGWWPFYDINDDLSAEWDREADIMKVYEPRSNVYTGIKDFGKLKLIWEREERRLVDIDGGTYRLSKKAIEEIKRIIAVDEK
jgi:hypothetical protein